MCFTHFFAHQRVANRLEWPSAASISSHGTYSGISDGWRTLSVLGRLRVPTPAPRTPRASWQQPLASPTPTTAMGGASPKSAASSTGMAPEATSSPKPTFPTTSREIRFGLDWSRLTVGRVRRGRDEDIGGRRSGSRPECACEASRISWPTSARHSVSNHTSSRNHLGGGTPHTRNSIHRQEQCEEGRGCSPEERRKRSEAASPRPETS